MGEGIRFKKKDNQLIPFVVFPYTRTYIHLHCIANSGVFPFTYSSYTQTYTYTQADSKCKRLLYSLQIDEKHWSTVMIQQRRLVMPCSGVVRMPSFVFFTLGPSFLSQWSGSYLSILAYFIGGVEPIVCFHFYQLNQIRLYIQRKLFQFLTSTLMSHETLQTNYVTFSSKMLTYIYDCNCCVVATCTGARVWITWSTLSLHHSNILFKLLILWNKICT